MGRVAYDEGDVTNERLRYVLNMHKTAISELLKLMVKNGSSVKCIDRKKIFIL